MIKLVNLFIRHDGTGCCGGDNKEGKSLSYRPCHSLRRTYLSTTKCETSQKKLETTKYGKLAIGRWLKSPITPFDSTKCNTYGT